MSKYKKAQKKPIIIKGYIIAPIMILLICLFAFVSAKGYPLWIINTFLVLNILCLIIMISFGELQHNMSRLENYKNRKKLLIWSLIFSIWYVIGILLSIFYNLQLPLIILFLVFAWLRFKYGRFGKI